MMFTASQKGDVYDIVVVGASFAGLSFTNGAATRGLRVLVLEKDGEIGGRLRRVYRHDSLGQALLLGDAAGLCGAATGGGIYPAIISGRLAAQAVANEILNGVPGQSHPVRIPRATVPILLLLLDALADGSGDIPYCDNDTRMTGQPRHSLYGAYRPMTMVAHAHPTSTYSTPDLKRFECHL